MTVTSELAEFVATTGYDDLPADALAAAKVVILDGLANAVAGACEITSRSIAAYYSSTGGTKECAVIGRDYQLPAATAALLNGASIHCLDFEVQGYPSAHGTSSMLPAILAAAERGDLGGRDVLTAFVVAWDVQQRLRSAGSNEQLRGFHPPGMVGPLAAAAGVASVTGMTGEQTQRAFGLAASRTGGLFGNNGTMTKATHPANAARSGLESADLARLGVTSNPDILTAFRGYGAAVFGGELDEAVVTKGLGSTFHLVDPGFSIKPYPAEIYMQWVIEAATLLREREGLSSSEIAELVVEPPVYRADLTRPAPQTGLDGKFSYEYCATVAMTEPRVGIATFSDEVRFRADVVDLLARVRVIENPEIPHDKKTTWSRVSVRTHDGRQLSETCRSYRGSFVQPMPDAMRLAKIQDCFTSGNMADRYEGIREAIEQFEDIDRVADLMRALQVGT